MLPPRQFSRGGGARAPLARRPMTEDHFETTYGLPRPRWDVIRTSVFEAPDYATRHQRWCEAQREWLRRLSQAMQQPYQVSESEHFIVLTAARGDIGWVTAFAEQARREIIDLLGERPAEA